MLGIRKIAIAVGMTASLLGATAAGAAATQSGGRVHLFVTYQTQTKDKVLLTGALGDYGKAISQDANGKVDPNGAFEKLTLKQGGFLINATALNNRLNHAKPQINKTNCSILFTATGPGTLENGTGAYAGIRGRLEITVAFAGVASMTAKGCDLANNAPLHGQYQLITATGSVSFK